MHKEETNIFISSCMKLCVASEVGGCCSAAADMEAAVFAVAMLGAIAMKVVVAMMVATATITRFSVYLE